MVKKDNFDYEIWNYKFSYVMLLIVIIVLVIFYVALVFERNDLQTQLTNLNISINSNNNNPQVLDSSKIYIDNNSEGNFLITYNKIIVNCIDISKKYAVELDYNGKTILLSSQEFCDEYDKLDRIKKLGNGGVSFSNDC